MHTCEPDKLSIQNLLELCSKLRLLKIVCLAEATAQEFARRPAVPNTSLQACTAKSTSFGEEVTVTMNHPPTTPS
jgi:hypothetical protein